MIKVGILVSEKGNWTFFDEIYQDLAAHYQTEIFEPKMYNTPLLYGRLNRWAFRSRMRSMLQQNDVCFFEWAGELLMRASQMPKRAAIVTRLHSFELYEWAPKINWNAVDKVILVSRAMQEQFSELYPDQAHKTEVVYNGRSLEAFKPTAKRDFDFSLGMLCNIKPVKRIYEVILMLYGLKQQGYEPHLRIAGEATGNEAYRYTAAVRRLVKRLAMEDNVTFDGYVTDTPTWLQAIDIFISNSYWEGHQVALLEAMASGCYCLSHFWGGVEEMLPPENIFITEAELGQKIIAYGELPEGERERCRSQLRTIASEKFDIEQTKADIRRIIEELK